MKDLFSKYSSFFLNRRNIIILFIVGILLLILPSSLTAKEKKTTTETESVLSTSTKYTEELEKKLSKILETIHGISSVNVMITLENNGELFYAENRETSEKNSENDINQDKQTQETGTLALQNTSSGGQSPILLKENMPRISGVLVTAKGLDDITLQSSVINAVRAVLDVPVHRVQVLNK